MRLLRVFTLVFTMIFLATGHAGAAFLSDASESVTLTVYNQGFVLIKEVREIELKRGLNTVTIRGVSPFTDPTSIHIRPLSSKDKFRVIEQSLDISTGKQGSASLTWLVESDTRARFKVELTYLSGGMGWSADYIAVMDHEGKTMDISSWVSLANESGIEYEDALLKLVAGDVHKKRLGAGGVKRLLAKRKARSVDSLEEDFSAPQAFRERGFFEYHIYELNRPMTLAPGDLKQVNFISAQRVPFKKKYLYDGFQRLPRYGYGNDWSYRMDPAFMASSQSKVRVLIEVKNTEKGSIGKALAGGVVQLYKKFPDGQEEFIGEDSIDHTPVGAAIELYAGNATELIGKRKQMDFKVIESNHIAEEVFEIELKNHKKKDVVVIVRERLREAQQWSIKEKNHAYEKKDARTIEFKVKVPAKGSSMVRYKVRYEW